MTRSHLNLDRAWTDFVADYPATHAVSLAYNPSIPGTASQCWRISPDGECWRLITPNMPIRPGENRLPVTRKVALQQVNRDIDKLHRAIDRKLFGAHFHKAPPERRTAFLGFIEDQDENVHVHLAWRVPECRTHEFVRCLQPHWLKLVPSGSVRITPRYDPEGWAEYITKEQIGPALEEPALFVSSRTGHLHS